MISHRNHRRDHDAIQDNGTTFESRTPSGGCNATHVAKCRAEWKRIRNRSFRRTGRVSPKFRPMKPGARLRAPDLDEDEG